MAGLVQPTVYFTGATEVDVDEVMRYLVDTKQMDFAQDWNEAIGAGIPTGLILCSLYAKLCYKSLVVGKNANVSKTRSVKANLQAAFDQSHGSVFEHCNLNFLVTNCSRVYTHEQVRQRVGWAYSQTSGRYCRLDNIDLVWDPVLDPVKDLFLQHVEDTERVVYLAECRLGLRKPNPMRPDAPDHVCLEIVGGQNPNWKQEPSMWIPDDSFDFDRRKRLTSAIRRIAPNGQANEIGMSCNVRALRHVVQLRTARFSETEIRNVFNQVYHLAMARFPLIYYKARTRTYDGLLEIYGMKQQPYDIEIGDPKALEQWSDDSIRCEYAKRFPAGFHS